MPRTILVSKPNRLIDFHTENYIANRMTLCVLGKQSLNELEKDVTKYFSHVPAAPERPAPTEAWWLASRSLRYSE